MALIERNKMIVILTIFLITAIQFGACKKHFFDEVPKELRCSGCELTVKVLDKMLGGVKQITQELVIQALQKVCDEKRFSISEYNSKSMVKTCKYMLDSHGQELMEELLKHYKKGKKSTYMELSQQICLNIMRLCPGAAHRAPIEDESEEHFHHFLKVSGYDAKIAKPVPQPASHDEL